MGKAHILCLIFLWCLFSCFSVNEIFIETNLISAAGQRSSVALATLDTFRMLDDISFRELLEFLLFLGFKTRNMGL